MPYLHIGILDLLAVSRILTPVASSLIEDLPFSLCEGSLGRFVRVEKTQTAILVGIVYFQSLKSKDRTPRHSVSGTGRISVEYEEYQFRRANGSWRPGPKHIFITLT